MRRALLLCLVVLYLPAADWRELVADGMEEGIDGWNRHGTAVFAHDTATAHAGGASARIEVTEPNYQRLVRSVPGRIHPGDRYRARAMVRTDLPEGGAGAYLFLEFRRNGQRLAIAHSEVLDGRVDAWRPVSAAGLVPSGCDEVLIGLALHTAGTAWFDDARLENDGLPAEERTVNTARIRIDPTEVTNPDWLGFGFHVFFHQHVSQLTDRIRHEVLYKRWRELRPSFARLTHTWRRGEEGMVELRATMRMMRRTGTAIYLTTWDPEATLPGDERVAYAARVAAMLARLRDEGCDNLRWYCLANELSLRGDVGVGEELTGWACLRPHKEVFADYHRLFHAALAQREVEVGLLAMDASPGLGIEEAEWAKRHIPEVSAAYGGHHYINGHDLDDLGFYAWFEDLCNRAAAIDPSKPFIIGEFGAKQHRGPRYGFERWDGCTYYDTDREPLVAIQVAEAVLAAVNGGVGAAAYWTFSDFPDGYRGNKRYTNKWGTSRWSADDHSTRDLHYGLALLTRHLRGPARVLRTVSTDARLRAACVLRPDEGVSVAVVNRHAAAAPLRIEFGDEPGKPLRRYVFDPSDPPQHPCGDLPGPDALVEATGGVVTDELSPGVLAVYTTDYETEPPPAVAGVKVSQTDGARLVSWTASAAGDLCYYRVYADGKQVGSTVATDFALPAAAGGAVTVRAVDDSGNEGD